MNEFEHDNEWEYDHSSLFVWNFVYVRLLSILQTVPIAEAIWLNIPSSGTNCMSEDIQINVVVLADYYVVDEGVQPHHTPTISNKTKPNYSCRTRRGTSPMDCSLRTGFSSNCFSSVNLHILATNPKGLEFSVMGHSGTDNIQEKLNPDWGKAFYQYEHVISSGNEAMRIKGTIKLAHLAKHAPENILACAIPILAELLSNGPSNNSSQPIQEAAVYCLKCIARRGDGGLATEIGESGAIQSILRLLPDSDNGFQRVMIKCLWVLVNFGSMNREIVARNGGLEIIINMLNLYRDATRRYLLEILSALTLLREVRRVLTSLGGLHFLVEAARCGSMVSRERACQAMGLLGVTRRVRRMLVELGVIPVLVELFRDGDSSTKLVVGNSLGVISAHIDYIRPVAQAGAIPLYAELLQGPEPIGREIAEDVFCILAVAEVNAVEIAEHLVGILREGDDEAKAAAADVFWDLSGYKHAESVVRNSGAIPLLVELLREGNSEVKEKVSGAIAQLSYDEADRVALANAGVIPFLIELMHDIDDSEELRDNAAEALINFSEDPLHCDRISEAIDIPAFQYMQNTLSRIRASDENMVRSLRRIRASDEHMVRSLRRISIDQLTWDPDRV